MQALFTSFYLNGHTLVFAFILCEPPHLSFLAMSPLGYISNLRPLLHSVRLSFPVFSLPLYYCKATGAHDLERATAFSPVCLFLDELLPRNSIFPDDVCILKYKIKWRTTAREWFTMYVSLFSMGS